MTAEEPAAVPLMQNGQPNPTGTGRYCPPRVCYCGGGCPWWTPIPEPTVPAGRGRQQAEQQRRSWETREGSTWIDDL